LSATLSETREFRYFAIPKGIDVDVKTGLSPQANSKTSFGDYDALVIRSATRVTEEILDAGNNLKVVGRAGIGLDNVDIPRPPNGAWSS
jgi:D-3-phosphoglycerate dehydrogenase